jgi:hypothetical protein
MESNQGFNIPVLIPNSMSSGDSMTLGPALTVLASGVAVGSFFRCPVRMHPRTIGGEPAAFQSRQNVFIVRLRASAARRFPSGVCLPLPGEPPWRRQRFLGRPSSSVAHIIKQGNPVDLACAKQRGHHLLRVPTICELSPSRAGRIDRERPGTGGQRNSAHRIPAFGLGSHIRGIPLGMVHGHDQETGGRSRRIQGR